MRSMTPEQTRICLGCWDQMHMPIPLKGVLALPFRAFGITRSKMNPNICTICERSFSYVKKQRHITADATILFADIRGFTHMSEHMDPAELGRIVSAFHDQCAQAIWSEGGIVNKQMGDGLMAIFNFPIKNDRHAEAGIRAAIDIQRRCGPASGTFSSAGDPLLQSAVGIGVGVHSGEVEIGEFSTFRSDFTAIGGAVNLTSRLEAQAGAGEILVSVDAAAAAPALMGNASPRQLTLKGIEQTVLAHVLMA